ncbi:MAG: hypothetical protein RMI91_13020 [Gemmatales bacterium]|nr:hypothetical protein [Gemmatales bacterium]MDW7995565.1 hypothetical protein [Gemmatales bacterium]
MERHEKRNSWLRQAFLVASGMLGCLIAVSYAQPPAQAPAQPALQPVEREGSRPVFAPELLKKYQ